jgi:adenine specific DNA methylase mod
MAALNDLINQITDTELRNRIQREVDKLAKQKKFGLVFEEHLPECTPLYDMPVKTGCQVMMRDSKEDKYVYTVLKLEEGQATCIRKGNKEEPVVFPVSDIVRVAEFGEPIYPYLKPLDTVCNAPDSDLWHTLIEADNYHALQLLEYLYAGKVDCIYIDPPYNTGARDWKYNNDYVDGNDNYRHSKWLSFMQRRLKLAKRLLNPKESVLIVTIDEKEYLHLGCLLEEIFPNARMQMVTIVTNPFGQERNQQLARVEEYAFYLFFGTASPVSQKDDLLNERLRNDTMGEATSRRRGCSSKK